MKINGFAKSYFEQAKAILKEVDLHYKNKEWNLVVRRCQETVELSLKALLRSLGFEVPRRHDIGFIFLKNKGKLPECIEIKLEKIVRISRDLSNDRENSFYGDESIETPAKDIYFKHDADRSKEDVEEMFNMVNAFFDNVDKNKTLPEPPNNTDKNLI